MRSVMTRTPLLLLAIISLAFCPISHAASNLEDLEVSAKVGPYGAAGGPSVAGLAPKPLDTEPYGYIATAHVMQGISVAASITKVGLKDGRIEIGEASGEKTGAREDAR
jgi:hypothetical protein